MLNDWLENEPKYCIPSTVISALALILSITGVLNNILPFDIAWVAIFFSGIPILVGALKGLILEHDIKADVMVAMALVASVIIKDYFAAGEVALIMQIGSLIEDFTATRAEKGLEDLIAMTPRTARKVCEGGEDIIKVENAAVGDIIRVLPGETVPLDGVMLEGSTMIDQSAMTGESVPIEKCPGDGLISGTVNLYGTFTMKVTKICEDSSLQRMIRLASQIEAEEAPIVRKADRWATWLVLVALSCSVLTYIFTKQFVRAVTVLVVFCPCAFILATPTAVAAGIANAARYGMIVRSGDVLERLAKVDLVAFDKTGTLTYSDLDVEKTVVCFKGITEEYLLRIAAACESGSTHPIAKAIARSADVSGMSISGQSIVPGMGVSATVDGKTALVGKAGYLEEAGIEVPEEYILTGDRTVVYVGCGIVFLGYIVLADKMREDAPGIIQRLTEQGIKTVLLTGDNRMTACRIAEAAGVSDVKSELMPEDKLRYVEEMRKTSFVAMVGDGVNDTLALKKADIGISMGGIGSDIAVEASDVVLVKDDIGRIDYLFRLAGKVMKRISTVLILSLIINFTAVLLSALGLLTPVTGALFHNCGSVFVIINAALILRCRDDK